MRKARNVSCCRYATAFCWASFKLSFSATSVKTGRSAAALCTFARRDRQVIGGTARRRFGGGFGCLVESCVNIRGLPALVAARPAQIGVPCCALYWHVEKKRAPLWLYRDRTNVTELAHASSSARGSEPDGFERHAPLTVGGFAGAFATYVGIVISLLSRGAESAGHATL